MTRFRAILGPLEAQGRLSGLVRPSQQQGKRCRVRGVAANGVGGGGRRALTRVTEDG